jgi:polyribonucleotide nucleotidyltransferase
MKNITETCSFGKHTLTLKTGEVARQASGSVIAEVGETVILATVVIKKGEKKDFLPLIVDYRERPYAAGKIPGGYFKREGRPSEKEILTSRLIDRPLRPLFPKHFTDEVQVVLTVLSYDPQVNPDVVAIIAASAALVISGAPLSNVLGASRVGYVGGEYLLNPSEDELKNSDLDLVVAGTQEAVLMVESEAKELSEEAMLSAVLYGQEAMQPVIEAIQALAKQAGKEKMEVVPLEVDEDLTQQISDFAEEFLIQAYQITDKMQRKAELDQIYEKVAEGLCESLENEEKISEIKKTLSNLEKNIVRERVIEGKPRIDGRDPKTVRPISIQVGVLPRAHGSALFTRGETQALVVATLGTERDAQAVETLNAGEQKEPFMLHYNFPPYCVGEVGPMIGPKRREIGHGNLAKRALKAVLPDFDDFPYVVRIVSEITESNGSSSMASVCGSSLSMMDAGISIQSPVAGIAMGLVKEEEQFVVLSDILGDEDHLGDMDFKVAGTRKGVTALQMDIKIQGITKHIMEVALEQAKEGRMHILDKMEEIIKTPREDVSTYAPRITSFKINPDKIRDIIGKGGETIRKLTEETQTVIDIAEDGTVKISATDGSASAEAKRRIEEIVSDVEVGVIYSGKVDKIVEFGAFISFGHKKSGLVHISQIKEERVEDVRDELSEGQDVKVKVIEIDRQGRVRLSMKDLQED